MRKQVAMLQEQEVFLSTLLLAQVARKGRFIPVRVLALFKQILSHNFSLDDRPQFLLLFLVLLFKIFNINKWPHFLLRPLLADVNLLHSPVLLVVKITGFQGDGFYLLNLVQLVLAGLFFKLHQMHFEGLFRVFTQFGPGTA